MLVDRIWPRELTKEHTSVDALLKHIAQRRPQDRFSHDPNRRRNNAVALADYLAAH